jgi:hypothetical protein
MKIPPLWALSEQENGYCRKNHQTRKHGRRDANKQLPLPVVIAFHGKLLRMHGFKYFLILSFALKKVKARFDKRTFRG